MTIHDIIARFFLSFSHETMIISLTLLGYIFYDRRKWGTAIYILLFTMIFSKFLKNIWQIPLPLHLVLEGYAFPSGHMQGATVFYGWIMLQCRSIIVTLICSGIMLGVAFGLLHFGYHIPRDIFGALGFALLTIALYHYLLTKFFVNKEEMSGVFLAVIGLLLIFQLPSIIFLWLAEGALVGFSVGWIIAKSAPMPMGLWNKMITLATSLAGVGVIKFLAGIIVASPAAVVFITYGLVGLWIGVTPWLTTRVDLSK